MPGVSDMMPSCSRTELALVAGIIGDIDSRLAIVTLELGPLVDVRSIPVVGNTNLGRCGVDAEIFVFRTNCS